jgi:hypothetical protein
VTSREHGRGFVRALVATRYLLGVRGEALRSGLSGTGDTATDLSEVVAQLSHGVRQERARVLAAEVGRLMRALQSERIR